MAPTSHPQDKFALLFSGPTLPRFTKDLTNVFETLTQYYGYPAANIHVVVGAPAGPLPAFPGAIVTTVASAADLGTALTAFAAAASGPAMAGLTTALLYFTGGGMSDPSGSRLVVDGGAAAAATVDPAWLAPRIAAIHDCHVHVVMQQAFGGGFAAALAGAGIASYSFSAACGAAQETYGDAANGSDYTARWVRGLRYEQLPAGTPNAGNYADELGAGAEAGNRLLALAEANQFSEQILVLDGIVADSTPAYAEAAGPQYLGLPELLIRDGVMEWWESPDIYLTYPNHPWVPSGDLYIADLPGATPPFNNTINIDVRNVGTHPVRRYSVAIEEFQSGIGAINQQTTLVDQTPTSGRLLPVAPAAIGTPADRKDIRTWNTAFVNTVTHACVLAEAKLRAADLDFAWSVLACDYEGQRNTDPMTIVPPPPQMLFRGIQGFREHIYGIQNRFDKPRRFALLIPDELEKFAPWLQVDLFELPAGPNPDPQRLEIAREPVRHSMFKLQPGENRELLIRVEMTPNFNPDELRAGLRIPFEILVEDAQAGEGRPSRIEGFAPIAGITIDVQPRGARLGGQVFTAAGRPAPEARVFVRSTNRRQGATVMADHEGRFDLAPINLDVYRVWAEGHGMRSAEQIVFPFEDRASEVKLLLSDRVNNEQRERKVRVILEQIMILDDKDPALDDAGELVFAAVVTPDDDQERQQVTRLPARGHFTASDVRGRNVVRLDAEIFAGVVKNEALSIEIVGQELDFPFIPVRIDISRRFNEFQRYRRLFTGDPSMWYGPYTPRDERIDPELLSDWALWYRIVEE